MEFTRRGALTLAIGGVSATMLPLRTWAASNGYEEIISGFTGGADIAEGGVDLGTPEIAENGNTVPVEVAAAGAVSIIVIASSVNAVCSMRASGHPTSRQAALARAGSKSAIAATSSPGVVGACDRNIEPNLPAPIRPTRTGFPLCARDNNS